MAKKKQQKQAVEPDSVYFLKLVLYFLLGCLWVQVGGEGGFALPVGFVIGIVFASHDHFQIDRKIEIAVLLIATILSFIAPIGFVLNIGS
jgi:hypothetical protein